MRLSFSTIHIPVYCLDHLLRTYNRQYSTFWSYWNYPFFQLNAKRSKMQLFITCSNTVHTQGVHQDGRYKNDVIYNYVTASGLYGLDFSKLSVSQQKNSINWTIQDVSKKTFCNLEEHLLLHKMIQKPSP